MKILLKNYMKPMKKIFKFLKNNTGNFYPGVYFKPILAHHIVSTHILINFKPVLLFFLLNVI